jgi:hypothetical protein
MEFGWGRRWTVAIVLLCGSAVAEVGTDGQVRVLVYASARVQTAVVDHAGVEVVRIFRSAGIELHWVNCLERNAESDCRNLLDKEKLILNVLPKGKTTGESVYGDAFLGEDGSGKYADIFFDRIREAHDEDGIDASRLLGAVAAHEIGHLLLGLRAHTWVGIMAPKWSGESLRQMGMGRLLFTPEQAARMKERVRSFTVAIENVELGTSSSAKTKGFPADQSYPSALCLRVAATYAYASCERAALQR